MGRPFFFIIVSDLSHLRFDKNKPELRGTVRRLHASNKGPVLDKNDCECNAHVSVNWFILTNKIANGKLLFLCSTEN